MEASKKKRQPRGHPFASWRPFIGSSFLIKHKMMSERREAVPFTALLLQSSSFGFCFLQDWHGFREERSWLVSCLASLQTGNVIIITLATVLHWHISPPWFFNSHRKLLCFNLEVSPQTDFQPFSFESGRGVYPGDYLSNGSPLWKVDR